LPLGIDDARVETIGLPPLRADDDVTGIFRLAAFAR
jgi:hypothetical protein